MHFSPSLKISLMHSHSSKSVIITLWTALKKQSMEATQRIMAAKLTSLTQYTAILWHLVAESCNSIVWHYHPTKARICPAGIRWTVRRKLINSWTAPQVKQGIRIKLGLMAAESYTNSCAWGSLLGALLLLQCECSYCWCMTYLMAVWNARMTCMVQGISNDIQDCFLISVRIVPPTIVCRQQTNFP